MDRARTLGLLVASLLAGPALASDCLLPAGARMAEQMTTVAPEMAAAPVADPFCVPADQAIARFHVPAEGAYVPKTQFDNTPWRFDMSQNGKRMTVVEFDAWMKAKGIRMATGKPAADPQTQAPPAPVQTGK